MNESKKIKLLSLGHYGTNCIIIVLVIFTTMSYANIMDDIHYMKACFPWFRPSESKLGPYNCSLGCSLQMAYTHQEVALCYRDGRTGIECKTDNDCKRLFEMSYCKKTLCLCEDKAADRYTSIDDLTADSKINFCVAPADIRRSIHIPLLPLFPWRTLLIIFGTLVMTGLLLMTLKWISPIISTIREYQGSDNVSQLRRLRIDEVNEAIRNSNLSPQEHCHPPGPPLPDKPPPYEAAVQFSDSLPSYDESQKPSYFQGTPGNSVLSIPSMRYHPGQNPQDPQSLTIDQTPSSSSSSNVESPEIAITSTTNESEGATTSNGDITNTRVKT